MFLGVPVKRFGMTKPRSCLKEKIKAFDADESGVTVIEYVVICVFIVSICVTILKTIGGKTQNNLKSFNGQF
jgi:Flp pilus assembly pilin Flp